MDGRLVTINPSEQGSSVAGKPKKPVTLRAQALDLINDNYNGQDKTGQDIKNVFLKQIWPKVENDYQKMASDMAKACKAELSGRSVPIQAVVENRVKSRRSIKKSLQRREIHREKEGLGIYRDIHTILGDMHDLVGIRIIVEYLDHLKSVSEFVTSTFYKEKDPNVFSANRQVGRSWPSWFGAYECTNYHISAKFQDDNPLSFYNGILFEIQVTSLPANMYNKIAHPLLYKEEAGPLSQGDEIVVDLTKGLAYCYSLCLYFKRYRLGGDVVEPSDVELLRNISSSSGELDQSSINSLAGKIPGLDVAAGRTKNIPRESLGLVLESLLNDRMPDDIGQILVDKFSREIKDIGQPQINLPTCGEARFDSQDVSSSPVCQEGTQTRAIQYIHNWIDGGDTPLLWIHSHAGTGKSTLARTLARELTETGRIAAGYFFKRGAANRNEVSRVFATIASQFMSTIARFEAFLRESVIACKNPDIQTMRLDEQFRVLIKVPLSQIGDISSTKVIVIDALDECTDLYEASKIINLLCSLENSSLLRFRLLVTGRNEPLAQKAVENQMHTSLSLATTFHDDNKSDISSILRLGFQEIRKEARIKDTWPTEEQFEMVLHRSVDPSPLFIYAATLLRFLKKGTQIRGPQRRLEMWIERSAGTADKSQLEVMYTTVFENLDRDLDDGSFGLLMDEEKQNLRAILGTIILAAEPLSIESIASISRVDSDTTQGLLTLCRAVLEISDNVKQPVKTVHKSFSDFLLKKCTRETSWFHVDEMELHDHIAKGCMCLVRTLRKDICEIGDPGVSRDDIESDTIESHISKSLQYASSYWWHHLQSGNKQSLSSESLVIVLKTHLLHWIECMAILDRLQFVSKAIRELCASINEHPFESVRTLVPFLKDASRFILRHGNTILDNPLQTYGAALVFSPKQSIVRHHFWETRVPGVRAIRSLENGWGACLKEDTVSTKIHAMAVSQDGQKLAMADIDTDTYSDVIWIYHTGSGTFLSELNPAIGSLALTWSNDGNYLLSITARGKVMRHDPALDTTSPTGYSPYSATERYHCAAICPLGIASVVRCSGLDYPFQDIKSEVFTWNFLHHYQTFRSWEFANSKVNSIALSPNGSLLAIYVEGAVKVLQVNTGAYIYELHIEARSFAFSPDGCRLFICPMGRNLLTLTILILPSGGREDLRLPNDFVADHMAILPDYTTVITTCVHEFRFWDLEALGTIVDSPLRSDPQHLNDSYQIKRFAISPSGQFMVTSSGEEHSLDLWRLPQGTFERNLAVDLSMGSSKWSFTPLCDVSIETEAFILSLDNSAHVWFLEGAENKEIKRPDALKLPMGDLCLSSIRKHNEEWWIIPLFNVSLSNGAMASVSFNDTVEVSELGVAPKVYFEFKTPREEPIKAMSLSPNSKYLAICYGTTIRIWNLADTSKYYELQTHGKIGSLVFSPDECFLVYTIAGSIWSWTMMPRQDAKCLLHDEGCLSLDKPVFSPSGNILACLVKSVYEWEKRVFLWDASSGHRLPNFTVSHNAHDLSFSRDDKILYLYGSLGTLKTCEFQKESYQLGPVGMSGSNYDMRIDVTDEWICCNTQRLLKIPVEYMYSIHGIWYGSNYLALSIHDRGVLLLNFQ